MRKGFTVIELMMVISIIAITAGMSVPLYRNYLIRNDLNIVTEQTVQALGRAQLLSQSGQDGGSWGFYAPTGTLYRGTTYALRTTTFDESYPLPSTITISGLTDVSFAELTGRPSSTGTIILTALNGEQRTVNILISAEGLIINDDDKLTICHKPNTGNCDNKKIPDSAWPGHLGHGDHLGACTEAECPDDDGEGSGDNE